jgi:catechol 2,3-dioxygenase-like lactoylglutathione lyase family enzyme
MTEISLRTVCLDCGDAGAMAAFYGGLLGWKPTVIESDWVLMRNPDGGVGLSFQADPAYVPPVWPESAGAQQKMIHLDVLVDDLEAAVVAVLEAGGRLHDHQPRDDLRVVLDPAGHPLCLFTV